MGIQSTMSASHSATTLLDSLNRSGMHAFSFEQMVLFVTFASRLKDDILLAQPANFSPLTMRPILPLSIQQFLVNSCDIAIGLVPQVWEILGHIAWTTNFDISSKDGRHLKFFHKYVIKQGLSVLCLQNIYSYFIMLKSIN